jgi:hypothetical protein
MARDVGAHGAQAGDRCVRQAAARGRDLS